MTLYVNPQHCWYILSRAFSNVSPHCHLDIALTVHRQRPSLMLIWGMSRFHLCERYNLSKHRCTSVRRRSRSSRKPKQNACWWSPTPLQLSFVPSRRRRSWTGLNNSKFICMNNQNSFLGFYLLEQTAIIRIIDTSKIIIW